MKKFKIALILLNLFALLAFVNYSVIQKERILTNGKLIFLELIEQNTKTPLIQGNMVILKYKIVNGLNFDSLHKRGFIVVKLDLNSIAERIRFQTRSDSTKVSEYLIEYSKGYFSLNIGAENYYIQQGDAKKYELAKYGGVKVDAKGNSILLGLYDANLKKIE
jgi:uncharacterized membrane-anchored protein